MADPIIEHPEAERLRFDLTDFVLGPIAAAADGLWVLFAMTAFLDLVGLVQIGRALWPLPAGEDPRGSIIGGLILIAIAHLLSAVLIPALAARASRRIGAAEAGIWSPARRLALAAPLMLFSFPLTLARFVLFEPPAWLSKFPTSQAYSTAVAGAIDTGVETFTATFRTFFTALTAALRTSLDFVETCFMRTPWPVVIVVVLLLAWRLAGPRTTIFTAAALAYIGLLGLWEPSLSTLALVAVSVAISIAIGLPLGIAAAKSRRFSRILEPVLDVMQTLPTFVYLIPAVALFSIGKAPGVIATVIFALPSMIRLTELGIRQVPANLREAANAFGASPAQLLWKVELPLALPSLRLGVNQTIMMSLSMVVVAALIGAGGLGEGVMKSLQFLKTGQGFIVGFAIVLCAMVLDRMVRGRETVDRRKDG